MATRRERDIPVVVRFPKALLCVIQQDAKREKRAWDEFIVNALRQAVGADRVDAMAKQLMESARCEQLRS